MEKCFIFLKSVTMDDARHEVYSFWKLLPLPRCINYEPLIEVGTVFKIYKIMAGFYLFLFFPTVFWSRCTSTSVLGVSPNSKYVYEIISSGLVL